MFKLGGIIGASWLAACGSGSFSGTSGTAKDEATKDAPEMGSPAKEAPGSASDGSATSEELVQAKIAANVSGSFLVACGASDVPTQAAAEGCAFVSKIDLSKALGKVDRPKVRFTVADARVDAIGVTAAPAASRWHVLFDRPAGAKDAPAELELELDGKILAGTAPSVSPPDDASVAPAPAVHPDPALAPTSDPPGSTPGPTSEPPTPPPGPTPEPPGPTPDPEVFDLAGKIILFVTKETFGPGGDTPTQFNSVEVARQRCQEAAAKAPNLVAANLHIQALMSSGGITVRQLVTLNAGPIFNPRAEEIFASSGDLWIQAPLIAVDVDQYGGHLTSGDARVWTGSKDGGIGGATCTGANGWEATASNKLGEAGLATSTTNWLNEAATPCGDGTAPTRLHLYCIGTP